MIGLELVRQTGNIGDVLADFIERQNEQILQKLMHKYGELPHDAIWRLLSPFATIDGTKKPIRETDLELLAKALDKHMSDLSTAFIKEAVAELENSRILRYRKEEQTYEVAHDTLAKQIAEKRSEEEKAFLKARRIVTEGLATFTDTQTLLSKEQLAYIQPYQERMESELNAAQVSFIRDSWGKLRRKTRNTRFGIIGAFVIAVIVILIVLFQQRKTRQALDDLLAAQAARERTELGALLQNAAQIAKGENCPPIEMRQTIDSLYRKFEGEADLKRQYNETMEKLSHCQDQ